MHLVVRFHHLQIELYVLTLTFPVKLITLQWFTWYKIDSISQL